MDTELATTKNGCLHQGNKWENNMCVEVGLMDYCTEKIKEKYGENNLNEAIDLKKDWDRVCYKDIDLPEYKKNQVMRYSLSTDGRGELFLENQYLEPYQVDRALKLIGKNLDEVVAGEDEYREWVKLSDSLMKTQNLSREQVERLAKDGSVRMSELYRRVGKAFKNPSGLSDREREMYDLMMNDELVELILKHGKNTHGLINLPLDEHHVKRLLDTNTYTALTSYQPPVERINSPAIISHAIKRGDLSPELYGGVSYSGMNVALTPQDIDVVMDVDPKYDEVYLGDEIEEDTSDCDRISDDGDLVCSDRPLVDYALEHELDADEIGKLKHNRDKFRLLHDVYEYQKLTPKQVEKAIEMGYFIPQILAYQKVSKTKLREMVDQMDYGTVQGQQLFSALWANKDLSKEIRKELAKKAGVEDMFGEEGHFVWMFIHPDKALKESKKVRKAVDEKIEYNPLKRIVGEYEAVVQ